MLATKIRPKTILRGVAMSHGFTTDCMSSGKAKYREARRDAFKRLVDAGCNERQLSLLLGLQMKTVFRWKHDIQTS